MAEEIKGLKRDIEAILEREDTKWKRYFHTWANHRKKINTIRIITDDSGRVWRKKEEVSRVFIE